MYKCTSHVNLAAVATILNKRKKYFRRWNFSLELFIQILQLSKKHDENTIKLAKNFDISKEKYVLHVVNKIFRTLNTRSYVFYWCLILHMFIASFTRF